MWPTEAGTPPRPGTGSGVVLAGLSSYLAILYVRSPAAFFDDSIFSPPLLPSMLTNPRTVCFCQPVASTISASVAPLARFIMAMTSAFLLFVPSAFGFPAAFLTRGAFFASLAFLAGLLPPLGFAASGTGVAMFSESIAFIWFLLCRKLFAVVTFITRVRRNSKSNLRQLSGEANAGGGIGGFGLFYVPDKTQFDRTWPHQNECSVACF